MPEHTIRTPEKSQLAETQFTPEGNEAKEQAKNECSLECHTLAQSVELEQKFLTYANNPEFEKTFGTGHTVLIARAIAEFQARKCPNRELCTFPPKKVLKYIKSSVESQILEAKQDKSNSELAQGIKEKQSIKSEHAQINDEKREANIVKKTKTAEVKTKLAASELNVAALRETIFAKIKPQNITGLRDSVVELCQSENQPPSVLKQAKPSSIHTKLL